MPTNLDRRLMLLASSVAPIAAATAAVAIGFLAAMFAAFAAGARELGMTLGWINDALVLVSYALAAPIAIAVARLLRDAGRITGTMLLALGLAAVAGITALQWFLVVGVLTFEEEIGPVSIAFAAFGAWTVATGWLGARSGTMPKGGRMGLLGASYVGFPFWAIHVGRSLRRRAQSGQDLSGAGDPDRP